MIASAFLCLPCRAPTTYLLCFLAACNSMQAMQLSSTGYLHMSPFGHLCCACFHHMCCMCKELTGFCQCMWWLLAGCVVCSCHGSWWMKGALLMVGHSPPLCGKRLSVGVCRESVCMVLVHRGCTAQPCCLSQSLCVLAGWTWKGFMIPCFAVCLST